MPRGGRTGRKGAVKRNGPRSICTTVGERSGPPVGNFCRVVVSLAPRQQTRLQRITTQRKRRRRGRARTPGRTIQRSRPTRRALITTSALFSRPRTRGTPSLSPHPCRHAPRVRLHRKSLITGETRSGVNCLGSVAPCNTAFRPLKLVNCRGRGTLLCISLHSTCRQLCHCRSLQHRRGIP